jgi:hypothetical protein
MQKLMIFFSFSLAMIFISSIGNAQTDEQTSKPQTNMVQVVDFHSTHRCATCNAIEQKTKEALNEYYKTEMENGTVTFQAINVDKKENLEISEEFQAYGTSLYLNIVKDGKSEKIDLTDFAFTYARDKDDSFEKGFVEEMNKALDKL